MKIKHKIRKHYLVTKEIDVIDTELVGQLEIMVEELRLLREIWTQQQNRWINGEYTQNQ
jgi:hypothetical protein